MTVKNVAYGSDPEQKMDVYLSEGRTEDTKVFILIHGGAWNGGDKNDFNAYVDTLKRREQKYAIFNINYRLATPPDLFPAQEHDVRSAIEFIAGKASEYKIGSKFVLIGASAGAHLALLQAYKQSMPEIKAVIDFFGPTDLVDFYNNPSNPLVPLLLQQVTGGTPTNLGSIYQSSSPINFVTNQSPPTLILHGGTDPLVPLSQSQLLKAELDAAGIVSEMHVYPSEGHGWFGANLSDSFNRIQAFLNAHVR